MPPLDSAMPGGRANGLTTDQTNDGTQHAESVVLVLRLIVREPRFEPLLMETVVPGAPLIVMKSELSNLTPSASLNSTCSLKNPCSTGVPETANVDVSKVSPPGSAPPMIDVTEYGCRPPINRTPPVYRTLSVPVGRKFEGNFVESFRSMAATRIGNVFVVD